MTSGTRAGRFAHRRSIIAGRKIVDAAKARRFVAAIHRSGKSTGEWVRGRGIDGRSLQAWKIFAGSSEGAHRGCVLLGIVATCRAQGVPIEAYLAWAFERLGTHREAFGLPLDELTPAALKKSLG